MQLPFNGATATVHSLAGKQLAKGILNLHVGRCYLHPIEKFSEETFPEVLATIENTNKTLRLKGWTHNTTKPNHENVIQDYFYFEIISEN